MQLLKVMYKYCHGVLSRKNLSDYQKKRYYISFVKKKKTHQNISGDNYRDIRGLVPDQLNKADLVSQCV